MHDKVAIVGAGCTGFRSTSPEQSYKEMIYEAAMRAYNDAGVAPRRDVESFVTVAEDFHEGTSIFDEYTPDQIGGALKPVHTITGDGLHGIATAYMLVRTGQFDIVAVEGHSKASNIRTISEITAYAQDPVLNRPLKLNTHFIAGLEMNRFLHETGTSHEQCAAVVVKNKFNALSNPHAPFGADLTIDDVLAGSILSWPLGIHESAEHADGAIVMVLASEEVALTLTDKPIWILGAGWSNDSPALENREWARAIYGEESALMAYRQAGVNNPLEAIDIAEIDDTYAYKELQALEALGFCRKGEAGVLTMEGFTSPDSGLPVNVSGGSLGMGNLLEANGLARAFELVLQLRGDAGTHQVEGVNVGLAQSWRGVPSNSGAVLILAS
jgi:acetyl-CoA C-acetyltransferase